MTEEIELAPADVVLSRSRGLVGWAIRVFTRRFGESRTKVTHAGIIVSGGSLESAIIVEALDRVRRHRLAVGRRGKKRSDMAVFRPTNLSPAERERIVAKAETYVGRPYGHLKILAHVADWLLQGAYVFRRLADQDRYPICSWVVAHSFAEAGKNFGVDPGAATPDDIWDFVTARPDAYVEVVPLGPPT